jgi:catechol 2,3-dioxygenase-like lactoylglutathione lyase family enzyme
MAQTLGHVTLVVRNYDEAVAFFTNALGFTVIEDIALGEGKRWILVGPPNSRGTSLLLAQASTQEEISRQGCHILNNTFPLDFSTSQEQNVSESSLRRAVSNHSEAQHPLRRSDTPR